MATCPFYFLPFEYHQTLTLTVQGCLGCPCPLSLPPGDTPHFTVPRLCFKCQPCLSSLLPPPDTSGRVALRHAVSNQYLEIGLFRSQKKKVSRCTAQRQDSCRGSPRFFVLSRGEARPLQTAALPPFFSFPWPLQPVFFSHCVPWRLENVPGVSKSPVHGPFQSNLINNQTCLISLFRDSALAGIPSLAALHLEAQLCALQRS